MESVAGDKRAIKWPRLYKSKPLSKTVKKIGRTWWVADEAHKCQACDHSGWCLVRFDEVICMRHDRTKWGGEGSAVEFSHGEEGYWHALTPSALNDGIRRDGGSTQWNPTGEEADTQPRETLTDSIDMEADPISQPGTGQLDDGILDRVYRAMLDVLHLYDTDREDLELRGLSKEAVVRKGYRTARPLSAEELQQLIEKSCLTSLKGIPGFYLRNLQFADPYWRNVFTHGIYIPYRNSNGLIVGLQMRNREGKYLLFSSPPDQLSSDGRSPKYPDGTPLRRTANVAIPQGCNPQVGELWLTEAGLKADIASEILNKPVVGVPGAGAFRLFWETTDLLTVSRDVIVAYDADKRSNSQVARYEAKLIAELQSRGHRVRVANWDVDEKGDPNGIDDLLVKGIRPRVELPKGQAVGAESTTTGDGKTKRFQVCPAPQWIHATPDLKTIDFATNQVHDHIAAALMEATTRPRRGKLYVRSDTFGVGKTTAVANVLRDRPELRKFKTATGEKELSVAVLTDSSREKVGAEEVKKAQVLAKTIGAAAIYLSGRTKDNCERIDEVNQMGRSHHSVQRAICETCFKWALDEIQAGRNPKLVKPSNRPKPICPYHQAHETALDYAIHVMHKSSLLNSSRKVSDYDVIVVDEELPDFLMRLVTLDDADLNTWKQSLWDTKEAAHELYKNSLALYESFGRQASGPFQKKYLDDLAYFQAVDAHYNIATVLSNCTSTLVRPPGELVEHQPLVPLLAEQAQKLGFKFVELLNSATESYCEQDKEPHFPHEKPVVHPRTKQVPVRAWREIINIIRDEYQRPTGDSQAYVIYGGQTPEGQIQGEIELRIPREDLIENLSKRIVVNLDATPNKPLLEKLFPALEAQGIQVSENVHVTQTIDGVFGSSTASKTMAKRVQMLVNSALSNATGRIGVLTHKATLKELSWIDAGGKSKQRDARVVVGYWGRDHRASNRYEGCDVLIISGYFIPPIDVVQREIEAWRRYHKLPRPVQGKGQDCDRAYGYCDNEGLGRSYRCRTHPDPDVDAQLRWHWSTNVKQAIGRLRGARSLEPLVVLLDTAVPADGVLISELKQLEGAMKQPEPLKAQTEQLKRERCDRIAQLILQVRPLYDRMRALGIVGRIKLQRAARESGIQITQWEAQQVLAALNNG